MPGGNGGVSASPPVQAWVSQYLIANGLDARDEHLSPVEIASTLTQFQGVQVLPGSVRSALFRLRNDGKGN